MNGMTESHAVGLINAQAKDLTLTKAIDLLKRANRYVGVHPSGGGQALGATITEFIAAYERQPDHIPDAAKMVSAAGGEQQS